MLMLEWTGDHPRLLQREPFAGDCFNVRSRQGKPGRGRLGNLKDELIQQFYGSAAILLIVMNPQSFFVGQGIGTAHGRFHAGPEIAFSPHFKRNRYTVRMLALGGSNAAHQDKTL